MTQPEAQPPIRQERLERGFDHLTQYDESCNNDGCECCAMWRGLVQDVVRITDGT